RYLDSLFEEAEDWNFEELDLPTLDYYESLSRGVSETLAHRTYQFNDDQGELLALRPDATAQVAKILSGRFSREEITGRYCYSCRNFRAFELRRGELREFHQFGAEIVSDNRYRSDVELLIFMFEQLNQFGLENIVVDLGHVQIYKGLINGTQLSDRHSRLLRQRIHRKNVSGLEDLLEDINMDDHRKEILLELPTLFGDEDIFDEIERFSNVPGETLDALNHLQRVYDQLETAGFGDLISLDFGVVRDLDYYTGIVFEALLPGIGKPIVGGGRYDQLYANYGASVPATGFAIELDRVLPVLESSDQTKNTRTVWCPRPTPEARSELRELRQEYAVSVIYDEPAESDDGYLMDASGEISELD
ncbi:MAG: ATP phosphoribosyltransferase regulatory subunit, partial [bacterium]